LEVLILLLPNKFLCQGVVAEPRGASREPGIWEQRTLPMSIIISNTYTIKQIQTVGPKYLSMGLLPLPPAKKKKTNTLQRLMGWFASWNQITSNSHHESWPNRPCNLVIFRLLGVNTLKA
jgi:hypothetical protein